MNTPEPEAMCFSHQPCSLGGKYKIFEGAFIKHLEGDGTNPLPFIFPAEQRDQVDKSGDDGQCVHSQRQEVEEFQKEVRR